MADSARFAPGARHRDVSRHFRRLLGGSTTWYRPDWR
jgi:hypothetical protein